MSGRWWRILKCTVHEVAAEKQGHMALQNFLMLLCRTYSHSGTGDPVTVSLRAEGQAAHHKAPLGTAYPDAISLSDFPMLSSIPSMDRFPSSVPWEYFVISVFTVLGFKKNFFWQGAKECDNLLSVNMKSKIFPCSELFAQFCLMNTLFQLLEFGANST